MFDDAGGDGLTRWMVLQSCLHSIGTAAVMAGAGLMLSKRGLLSPAVSKGLAKISMNLTIPCLLFSTVVDCPQVCCVALYAALECNDPAQSSGPGSRLFPRAVLMAFWVA